MDEELEKQGKNRGEGKILEYLVLAALIVAMSGTVGYLGRAWRDLPEEAGGQPAGDGRAGEAETEAVPEVRLWEGAVWRADKPEPGEDGVEWWHYSTEGEEFFGEPAVADEEGWREPSFRRVCLWKDGENRVHWQFEGEVDWDGRSELDWRAWCLGDDGKVRGEWAAETEGMEVLVELAVRVECLEFAFGWTMEAPTEGGVSAKALWEKAEAEWARSWKGKDDEIKARRTGILEAIRGMEEELGRLAVEETGLWEQGKDGKQVPRDGADRRYAALLAQRARLLEKKPMTHAERVLLRGVEKELEACVETSQLARNGAARKRAKAALEEKRGELAALRPLVSASGRENTARSRLRQEGKVRVSLRVEAEAREREETGSARTVGGENRRLTGGTEGSRVGADHDKGAPR